MRRSLIHGTVTLGAIYLGVV